MRVQLNVGGKIFETTSETLELGNSSYFRNLLSNKYKNYFDKDKDKQIEEIFIDRSPKNFERVLDYLRNPNTKVDIKYKSEFDYYLIKYDNSIFYDKYEKYEKMAKKMEEIVTIKRCRQCLYCTPNYIECSNCGIIYCNRCDDYGPEFKKCQKKNCNNIYCGFCYDDCFVAKKKTNYITPLYYCKEHEKN